MKKFITIALGLLAAAGLYANSTNYIVILTGSTASNVFANLPSFTTTNVTLNLGSGVSTNQITRVLTNSTPIAQVGDLQVWIQGSGSVGSAFVAVDGVASNLSPVLTGSMAPLRWRYPDAMPKTLSMVPVSGTVTANVVQINR